jgi:hypothetical protein
MSLRVARSGAVHELRPSGIRLGCRYRAVRMANTGTPPSLSYAHSTPEHRFGAVTFTTRQLIRPISDCDLGHNSVALTEVSGPECSLRVKGCHGRHPEPSGVAATFCAAYPAQYSPLIWIECPTGRLTSASFRAALSQRGRQLGGLFRFGKKRSRAPGGNAASELRIANALWERTLRNSIAHCRNIPANKDAFIR